jgi:S-DNA-T family DNA segregation ATPase FtsK/SpoIIIE
VLAQWPLPTGLGGAVGDLTLGLAEWIGGGALSGGIYAALFVVLCGLSLGLLWTSYLRRPAGVSTAGRPSAPIDERDNHGLYDDETEGPSDGRLRLLLGIAAHWALTAKAAGRRLLRRIARRGSATDSFRKEPLFRSDDMDFAEEGEFDDAFAEAVAERSAPAPAQRRTVQPPAPRPKPSSRAKKEAQPSFLPPEDFELPPLNLLFEPPPQRRREKTVDSTALEQNARLLEGVLEDFGVRGEIINIRPGPVVTLYELEPAPGIKSSRVIGLADDIARSMSAISARVAVIPARTPSASNCRTSTAKPSSCASSWPPPTTTTPRPNWLCRSARPSVASRSSPIWRACRIFWSPARPARANRCPSTR